MRNCTKKKHEYRIHEPLSNGQWLNLYFEKKCTSERINIWETGLCISKSVKAANEWFIGRGKGYKKINNRMTGKCGIEGLRKALNYICEFASNLKCNEELHVGWVDEKRKYAYRKLLKHNFFVDEDYGFYHARNTKYWKQNELSISELTKKAYKGVNL